MSIKLPDAELEVLAALWRLGKATAKEIRLSLKPKRDHATITTLLRRLEDRKFVRRKKSTGRREFVYEAIARPEKTRLALAKKLMHRAFDGSGVALVNTLFQSGSLTSEEIDQLQATLKELKSRNGDSNE